MVELSSVEGGELLVTPGILRESLAVMGLWKAV